jgi:molybdopterin molybdotransferase
MVPAIRALLGDPQAGDDPSEPALLGADLPANDGRQDYVRATLSLKEVVATTAAGEQRLAVATATPHARQDSSMLGILARSDALIVRPAHAPPAGAGKACRIIRIERFC